MMSDRAETKRTVSRTTDLLRLAAMGLVSLVMLTIFLHQRPDGPTQLNTIRDCRDSDFAQTAPLPHADHTELAHRIHAATRTYCVTPRTGGTHQ